MARALEPDARGSSFRGVRVLPGGPDLAGATAAGKTGGVRVCI
jgi:hypothetical protein